MIREDNPKVDMSETLWELKDILRDVDRCLNDSNILTDTEQATLYHARDGIATVMEQLKRRKDGLNVA